VWREIEEFDLLRTMIEHSARAAGIELDLSDLDPSGAPEEFERAVRERMGAAAALFEDTPSAAKHTRKPTKAQAAPNTPPTGRATIRSAPAIQKPLPRHPRQPGDD